MSREVKIGLTLFAGVILLYLFITWARSTHLFATDRYSYRIVFQDISGLMEGDPVTVFGYPAGNVEKIDLTSDGAEVKITLNKDVALYQDAAAEIRVKELMGGKLIALNPGSGGKQLDKNALIEGTTSLDFSSGFSKMGEFFNNMDMNRIDSLVINVNRAAASFASLGEQMEEQDFGAMFTDLKASAAMLNRLLAQMEQKNMVGKMDSVVNGVNKLTAAAEKTMGTVDSLAIRLNRNTLPQADSMMNQISSMLGETEQVLASVEEILNAMKDKDTFVGMMMFDPEFASKMDSTITNLNVTLDHIRTKKIRVGMSLSTKQKEFEE